MRYTDNELFELNNELLDDLKQQLRFNEFCIWAIDRLKYLIEDSTNQRDWMQADLSHLRNYRMRAICFYQEKMGK